MYVDNAMFVHVTFYFVSIKDCLFIFYAFDWLLTKFMLGMW